MIAPKWRIALYVATAVTAVTILAAYVYFNSRAYYNVVSQMRNAKDVCRALYYDYIYVGTDNDIGTYPRGFPNFPDGKLRPEARQFYDLATGQKLNWIYYGGYSNKELPPKILLASPRMVDTHKRIMFLTDGSGTLVDEDEFVARLSEQLNRK